MIGLDLSFEEGESDKKPKLGSSEDVKQMLKKSKVLLHSSVKIQSLGTKTGVKNPKKLIKTLSLNTESSDNSILNQSNPAQKFENDSLYREKIRIMIQKNEDILESPQSEKNVKAENGDKKTTLKKLIKLQKQKSKHSLLTTLEAIKSGLMKKEDGVKG